MTDNDSCEILSIEERFKLNTAIRIDHIEPLEDLDSAVRRSVDTFYRKQIEKQLREKFKGFQL